MWFRTTANMHQCDSLSLRSHSLIPHPSPLIPSYFNDKQQAVAQSTQKIAVYNIWDYFFMVFQFHIHGETYEM